MGVTPSDNTFIHSNFLLETKSSIRLYHEYAKELPIIDYHNHLSPKAIAQNTVFNSITQLEGLPILLTKLPVPFFLLDRCQRN